MDTTEEQKKFENAMENAAGIDPEAGEAQQEGVDPPVFGNDPPPDDESSASGDRTEETGAGDPDGTAEGDAQKGDPRKDQEKPEGSGEEGEKEEAEQDEIDLTCPYCGEPLTKKTINGITWYRHEPGSRYNCKARFKGKQALREEQDKQRAIVEEEAAAEAEEEERRRKEEEERRKEQEIRERPIRQTAEEIAQVFKTLAETTLKEMLAEQKPVLDEAAATLRTLLDEAKAAGETKIARPERTAISTAVANFQTKLKDCSEDDPKRAVYEFFRDSYNSLLAAYDSADRLITEIQGASSRIQKELTATEDAICEKMKGLTNNEKEYLDAQKMIRESNMGTINRVEMQLKTLEQVYFRRFG